MSVDPSALSLRVSPDLLRHEILGLDGADHARAAMVVADVFYRSDALEHFESLPHAERTQFLAEVHALAEHCPRRWPIDVGTAGLPARLLDADETVRFLAEVFEFFEQRCYFAAELGYYCVDDRSGHYVPIMETIADRLGVKHSDSMQAFLGLVGPERLGDCVAIAREYVARPPERHYHSYSDCGWHPGRGMFSPEEGRRYFDDVLASVAGGSVLGPSLRTDRSISRAKPFTELVIDPLRRTALVGAPPEAYLPHGSILTMVHLLDHLRLLGRHEVAVHLAGAHRLGVEADGPADDPRFTLVVETPAQSWPTLQAEQETILNLLGDLSAATWSMTWRPPPVFRRGAATVLLDTDAVRRALAESSVDMPPGTAFRLRPRPTGGGTQLVVLAEDPRSHEAAEVEQAVFKAFEYNLRTARALAGAADPLRAIMQSAPTTEAERRPRVTLLIPRSEHMQADIVPVLHDACDVSVRSFLASAPDAGQQLAGLLRDIVAERDTDAVLIARGGGSPEQLQALCVEEVKRAVGALTDAGKLVVVAIGHATFQARIDAAFEAKVPNGAARVLRAKLVDHPRRLRELAGESQARIAVLPVDERFPDELAAEERFLRERIRRATEDHDAELELHRQPEV